MDETLQQYRKTILDFLALPRTLADDVQIITQLRNKISDLEKVELFITALGNSQHTLPLSVRVQNHFANTNKDNDTQRQQFREKIQDLTSQLSAKTKEASALKTSLESANMQIKQLQNNIKSSAKNLEDIASQRKKNDISIKNLKEEVKTLLTQKSQLEEEQEKLSEKIKNLEIEAADKSKKVEEQRKQIVSLEHKTADLVSEVEAKNNTILDSEKQLEEMRLVTNELEERYNKLEARRTKETKILNQEINGLNRQMHSIKINNDAQMHALQEEKNKQLAEAQKSKQESVNALNKEISDTKSNYEKQLKQLKDEKQQERRSLIDKKDRAERDLINQYETRINELIAQYDAKIQEHLDNYEEKVQQTNKMEADYQDEIKQLKLEMESLRNKTQVQDERIIGLLQVKNEKTETIERLNERLRNLEETMTINMSNSEFEIKTLKAQMKTTTESMERDFEARERKLKDTIRRMENEHRQAVMSIQVRLMDEKEYQLSIEKKKLADFEEIAKERELKLQEQLLGVQNQYKSLQGFYDKKFESVNEQNRAFVVALNERQKYEIGVLGEKKDRQKQDVINKYQIKINALETQYAKQKMQITLKMQEDKQSALARQKNAYDDEIDALKRENALQIRQKQLQFDRKIKMYEKKITDEQAVSQKLQKKLNDVQAEAKRKIQGLTELHYLDQKEVEKAKDQVEQAEIQKQQIRNQLETNIHRLETDIVQLKQIHAKKEEHLLQTCKHRISQNLQEMKQFQDSLRVQIQNLQEKHSYAQQLLRKQYEQLQYLYEKRPSRPEDIEAVKIMHKAYLDVKEEIKREKLLIVELKKRIVFMEATNKVINLKQLDQGHTKRVIAGSQVPFFKKKQKEAN